MGIRKIVEKAIFLDRDGVINPNVVNKANGKWESPYFPEDFVLFPWTVQALQLLQKNEFKLFLISNQPAYAKGTASLENIQAIQTKLHSVLMDNQIFFAEYYYCYHHPLGIVPELSIKCSCRKPGALFLNKAKNAYSLSMSLSWMIGDRDTDIICGQVAGTRTIMIVNQNELLKNRIPESTPDYKAANLLEAADIIIRNTKIT
jgi:D-glycero-D-manno-heptose 1,7-bisphosphate phosphatase